MFEHKYKINLGFFVFVLLPSDNFSPESGGSANPSSAIDAIKTQGTIKLKK